MTTKKTVVLFGAGVTTARSYELVANPGLDWTLVRIPNLKDGPANGKVDVGWYGRTKLSMKRSRGDLAKFLVDQVADKTFVRAAPGIANR